MGLVYLIDIISNFIFRYLLIPLITFLIGISLTPLRKWIYSDSTEYCLFRHGHESKETSHQVFVTKRFGKVVKINCPHYKKIEKTLGKKGELYYFCPYGEEYPDGINNGTDKRQKCRFL